jgi:hypothetical protein
MLEITRESIEKAIEKARITKPKVKVIQFRLYSVTNKTTGANYEVTFTKIGGRKFGECTCPATKICYHIGASIGAHIIEAEKVKTAETA